jgi:hypothetical protein
MERPDSRLLRIVNGRVVGEGTANATIQSKWRAEKAEKIGEGSGRDSTMEMEEQEPTTPARTEIDENNNKEVGMMKQDKGKGREMDAKKERAKKEWLSWYSRDLILPEGGLPDNYMTGVIRVVDGNEYVTGPDTQWPRTTESGLITKSNFRSELRSHSRIQ